MGRFNRFLHLEKDRGQKEGDAAPSPDPAAEQARTARFGAIAMETAAAAPAEAASESAEGHTARFEEAKPGELALHDKRGEDQPFIRCAVCKGDNTRFARECQHCQADLDTPDQRAFNEALWVQLRAQRDLDAAAHAEALAAKVRAAEEEARQRRAMYEELARDVRRETEAGLSAGLEPRPFRWRGRTVRRGDPKVELGAAVAVGAVLLVFAGAFGSCRTAAAVVPLILIAGGVLALRYFLSR